MFKDYDKYLSKSLQVYLFVLVLIIILKIVGLDYFGLDMDNSILMFFDDISKKFGLEMVWYGITLFIFTYIILSISSIDNSKKLFIYTLFTMPLNMIEQIIKSKLNYSPIYIFSDFVWLFILLFVYIVIIKREKIRLQNIIYFVVYCIINILFQIISVFVRDIIGNIDYNNFIMMILCNFDYVLLSIIAYKIFFIKGGKIKWEAGSFSQKKQNLKKLPKKLQKNYQSNLAIYKGKSKEEKLTFIIYFILSLIWNVLSVLLILFVAKINGTLIECIFILTSFWLSKGKFGKPFHFNSMLICFIVSNSSYYILNRMTFPIGVSIIVPILLGVGLSYVTSKFVKKKYKPLYKGMSEDLFEETILQVEDKDSLKYKICYDSYILKETDVSLSYKYNYSVPGIRKIKDRINKKIKDL